ncbi:MAG: hypothetical protein ABSA59_24365 [Terriglobia bacterium]
MANGARPETATLIPQPGGSLPEASLPWAGADLAWLAGLCLAAYAFYLPVLGFDFVFDDRPFILQNPSLLSWHSVPQFFTAHLVAFLHPHSQGTYYRPCLLLWLWVQHKLWNLHPMGWHLSTLTLHVLASLSVYMLAREILRRRFGAGVAALVFALHPAHVESAAWIMGLPDPLMTLFAVSALVCHIRRRRSLGPSRPIWAATSLWLYAAAVLTKEVALTVPALMFAYEWIFPPLATGGSKGLAGRFRDSLVPTLGYWGVTGVYLAARWAALGGLSHPLTPLAWQTMLATWPAVLWLHLKLLVWPVGLSAFYDVPYTTHLGLTAFALPLAAVVACGMLLLRLGGKSPQRAFAGVWLFLPMALLLNLRVFPQGEIVHDRFMYFSSVGFSILTALGMEWFAASPGFPFSIRARQAGTVAALGILLGGATIYYERWPSLPATTWQPTTSPRTFRTSGGTKRRWRFMSAFWRALLITRWLDTIWAIANTGPGASKKPARISRAPSPSTLRNRSPTSIWASRIFAPATWRKRLQTFNKRSRSVRKTRLTGSVWAWS